MKLEQAVALSNLRIGRMAPLKGKVGYTRDADEIAERIYALAEEQGKPLDGVPGSWRREWLSSRKFILIDLPLHFAACPLRVPLDASRVQGCLRAAADSVEPIVVDMNKKQLGMANSGFFPPVIVVDGKHRHAASRLQGRQRIRAWVGDLAAKALGIDRIHADHQFGSNELREKLQKALNGQHGVTDGMGVPTAVDGAPHPRPYIEETYPLENYVVYSCEGKKYRQSYTTDLKSRSVALSGKPKEVTQKYVNLKAAAEKFADGIRQRIQMSVGSLESSMQLFAAAGAGMGGAPSSSLSQGSGPSLAMKPRPTPGGKVAMPVMRSKGGKKKKLTAQSPDGGGYEGYKSATAKQSMKTRGGSKSEMTSRLKGSGYFGYTDATDKEQQRMKSPKGSEFEDKKTRNRSFSSDPDIGPLKGEAEILADAQKVGKIWNECRSAMKAGWKPKMEGVAPPGMEDTVMGLKKHFPAGSASPFKLAWYMHNKRKRSKK